MSVFVCQISDLSKRCSSVRVKVCPDGQLQCGNGECIGVEFFCDKKPDCSDGRFLQSFLSSSKVVVLSHVHSDENACSVTEDPNRADVSGFANLLFETTDFRCATLLSASFLTASVQRTGLRLPGSKAANWRWEENLRTYFNVTFTGPYSGHQPANDDHFHLQRCCQ